VASLHIEGQAPTTTRRERAGVCGGCGVYSHRCRNVSLVEDGYTELARLLCPVCRDTWKTAIRQFLRR
jgi:hypothetical protein